MRLLYFSRSYTPHDRRFLAELAVSDHEIWYLRLEDEPVRYELRPVPEGVHALPALSSRKQLASPQEWLSVIPSLESVLRKINPDLVHAGPIQSCAFLAALTGFHPLLAMSWGSDLLVEAHENDLSTWITRYTLRQADMLASDCGEVSREAQAIAQLPADRILQFPWGVDLVRFQPGTDSPFRPTAWDRAVVAIATRSWEPGYGVLELLEGFQHASQTNARLRLLLLGEGSLRPQVEAFIREKHLQRNIALCGGVPHEMLSDYFRAADFYISCAYSDGSSISLLEAMASALPAVVTDRPSNREWICDRTGGRLVPFGDVRAISAAIQEITALTPERRKAMGRHNRGVVEMHADWRASIRKLLAAYEQLRACDEVLR